MCWPVLYKINGDIQVVWPDATTGRPEIPVGSCGLTRMCIQRILLCCQMSQNIPLFVSHRSDARPAGGDPRHGLHDREPSLLGDPLVARQVSGQCHQGLPSESPERAQHPPAQPNIELLLQIHVWTQGETDCFLIGFFFLFCFFFRRYRAHVGRHQHKQRHRKNNHLTSH